MAPLSSRIRNEIHDLRDGGCDPVVIARTCGIRVETVREILIDGRPEEDEGDRYQKKIEETIASWHDSLAQGAAERLARHQEDWEARRAKVLPPPQSPKKIASSMAFLAKHC